MLVARKFIRKLPKSNGRGSLKVIVSVVILVVLILVASLVFYYYDAYHKLTFQLNDVSLGDVSLTSLQIDIGIVIQNPNLLPIYIPSGNFEIYINGQHLGQGTFGSLTIAGNSQNQIIVPLTFNAQDVPSALYGIITGGGNITVTTQGSISLVLFSIPFNMTLYNAELR